LRNTEIVIGPMVMVCSLSRINLNQWRIIIHCQHWFNKPIKLLFDVIRWRKTAVKPPQHATFKIMLKNSLI